MCSCSIFRQEASAVLSTETHKQTALVSRPESAETVSALPAIVPQKWESTSLASENKYVLTLLFVKFKFYVYEIQTYFYNDFLCQEVEISSCLTS